MQMITKKIYKTLNVIQMCLLLCSPVTQGAFKFRSCAHHCGQLIVALQGNDGFQYADSECVKEVRCFLSDLSCPLLELLEQSGKNAVVHY